MVIQDEQFSTNRNPYKHYNKPSFACSSEKPKGSNDETQNAKHDDADEEFELPRAACFILRVRLWFFVRFHFIVSFVEVKSL